MQYTTKPVALTFEQAEKPRVFQNNDQMKSSKCRSRRPSDTDPSDFSNNERVCQRKRTAKYI